MENKKKALGMGLEQLFNNENLDLANVEKKIYETANREEIIDIKISDLRPNPYQPRKVFDEEAIEELSNSIKEHGVIQPIIIKKAIKGYEIIAGERRVRASKKVGLEKIPAIIRNFTDTEMMEIALLENLQRENLTAIEEAHAYQQMLRKLKLTHDELSKRVGKSRSHITNILGLLRLPQEVQEMIVLNKISMGHARILSKLDDDNQIIETANKIIKEAIPVRKLEKVTEGKEFERRIPINRRVTEENENYKYVENLVGEKLDTKVKIKDKKIIINFNNVADLNRILEILNIKE
ncbi:MAG: ParB/RepB/Spo0J family partition protein [Bacilli bacterium]|nr:ParB/RepB/Spo0J family partition protein [Bacilli bacterium]MDD4282366.1 ParB/RepB/Spo0J family partition protein [Bacilli bacterium]MDD4718259.1 ParB/RepB/Spo0J family partition protein [Bacilli bacterium]